MNRDLRHTVDAFISHGLAAQRAVDDAIAQFDDRQKLIAGVQPAPSAPPPRSRSQKRTRAARFVIDGRFAGVPKATITITPDAFQVRPKGSRRVYEKPLSDVARNLLQEIEKAEKIERLIAKRRRRGGLR